MVAPELALLGKPVVMPPDEQIADWLYVADAAEGILLALEHYEGDEPVNIGAGFELSIRELATKISELTGFEGMMTWDTSKPDGQPRRRLDTTRAARYFGFKAQTNIKEGLDRTISWYLNHREGETHVRALG